MPEAWPRVTPSGYHVLDVPLAEGMRPIVARVVAICDIQDNRFTQALSEDEQARGGKELFDMLVDCLILKKTVIDFDLLGARLRQEPAAGHGVIPGTACDADIAARRNDEVGLLDDLPSRLLSSSGEQR